MFKKISDSLRERSISKHDLKMLLCEIVFLVMTYVITSSVNHSVDSSVTIFGFRLVSMLCLFMFAIIFTSVVLFAVNIYMNGMSSSYKRGIYKLVILRHFPLTACLYFIVYFLSLSVLSNFKSVTSSDSIAGDILVLVYLYSLVTTTQSLKTKIKAFSEEKNKAKEVN